MARASIDAVRVAVALRVLREAEEARRAKTSWDPDIEKRLRAWGTVTLLGATDTMPRALTGSERGFR
jgi:hypothetical protein